MAGGLEKVSHYSFVLVSSLCRRLCVLLLIEFVYIARKFDVCKLGEWEEKRRKILFEKFSASLSMMVEKWEKSETTQNKVERLTAEMERN